MESAVPPSRVRRYARNSVSISCFCSWCVSFTSDATFSGSIPCGWGQSSLSAICPSTYTVERIDPCSISLVVWITNSLSFSINVLLR